MPTRSPQLVAPYLLSALWILELTTWRGKWYGPASSNGMTAQDPGGMVHGLDWATLATVRRISSVATPGWDGLQQDGDNGRLWLGFADTRVGQVGRAVEFGLWCLALSLTLTKAHVTPFFGLGLHSAEAPTSV